MRRVAITGIGAVTPLGNDAASTWASLVAGRSGAGPITAFDASTFPTRIAAEVKGFDVREHVPGARDRRRLSRAAGFGAAAAAEALRHAGGDRAMAAHPPEERAVAVGASIGRPEPEQMAELLVGVRSPGGARAVPVPPHDVLLRNQNGAAAHMAQHWDCRGPMVSVSTACAGSAHALGEALRLLQDGEATLALAGGLDALTTWLDVLGFGLLGALASGWDDQPERASRPFDARRSGFLLGEGAVMVVLEDREAAVERGATILAELAGYGSTLNAYRITDSPPDGGGAVLAMASALADAGITPADVDYVAAHGTGTEGNDLSETAAIKRVLGEHAARVAVSSPKSMAGHLTSAAGGLNLLAAVGAIRHGVVPPTINLDHPDPRLDLDYVPGQARAATVRAALVNAFAFGGTNASLAVLDPEVHR